jgi:exodeoxyribonuclease VII small subunit
MKPKTQEGAPKFEECLQRLEQIVEQLEKGDIPLEQSLALFEEGMKLSQACRGSRRSRLNLGRKSRARLSSHVERDPRVRLPHH